MSTQEPTTQEEAPESTFGELPKAGETVEPERTEEPSQVEGVTVEQAVTLFHVSLSTLRRRLQKGEVPGAVLAPGPKGQAWKIPPASLEGLGYKAKEVREVEVKAAKVSLEAESLESRVKELESSLEVERVRREAAERESVILRESLDNLREALSKIPPALPQGKPSRWWRKAK